LIVRAPSGEIARGLSVYSSLDAERRRASPSEIDVGLPRSRRVIHRTTW
jgi:hypothetical protein